MQHQIANEWREYWRDHARIPQWDYTSELVLEALSRACGSFEGRSVLEAGSGTGRISREVAKRGGRVVCIDISRDAIEHTRRVLSQDGSASVAEASLFALPFNDATFDVVWNAGVLEHFSEPERKEALRELLRVTRVDGLVVSVNPNRGAVFYRFAKSVSERMGQWPYGHEDPIASLRKTSRALACEFVEERSTGFFIIFVEALRFSSRLMPVVEVLRDALVTLHQGPLGDLARGADRRASALLGGYLLTSVFRRS